MSAVAVVVAVLVAVAVSVAVAMIGATPVIDALDDALDGCIQGGQISTRASKSQGCSDRDKREPRRSKEDLMLEAVMRKAVNGP